MFCPAWSIVTPVGVILAKFHFDLLHNAACSAERLCEGEICCLEHRRKVSVLCLLYKIYNIVDHPMNEYLNHFAAATTRALATLWELAIVILCFRTDQFSRSFLLPAARLWNLQPSGLFSCDTLSSFKSTMKLGLLRAYLDF